MDIKKIADDHWKYVKMVICLHEQADCQVDIERVIDMIGCHYRSALIHGYGHGLENGYKQGIEAARKGNNV